MINGSRNRDAPVMLCPGDDIAEIFVQQQVVQVRVALVGLDDAIEEFRADDATAAPNGSDVAKV